MWQREISFLLFLYFVGGSDLSGCFYNRIEYTEDYRILWSRVVSLGTLSPIPHTKIFGIYAFLKSMFKLYIRLLEK